MHQLRRFDLYKKNVQTVVLRRIIDMTKSPSVFALKSLVVVNITNKSNIKTKNPVKIFQIKQN